MKFATVLGATSGQNSMTISPALVLMTATSLLEGFGALVLFVEESSADAEKTPTATAKRQVKINDFIFGWENLP